MAALRSSWVRYLLLGLVVAFAVTDADHHKVIAWVIAGVAAVAWGLTGWQMLSARYLPSREQVRSHVARLETDPDTQYRVHRIGVVYWLINFPVVVWLFFFHRDFWDLVGIFITLVYSVYANLATDYGAMSSAMAAKGLQPPPEIPLQEEP